MNSNKESFLIAEIEELQRGIREIYEVWAGSESYAISTSTESYQQFLIDSMRDIAADHLELKKSPVKTPQGVWVMHY